MIKHANDNGFTVNLSCDSPAEADKKADLNIGPVVTVLPKNAEQGIKYKTPKGRKIVTCPATLKTDKALKKDINCKACGLCQKANRKFMVGFPVHGVKKTAFNAQLVKQIEG